MASPRVGSKRRYRIWKVELSFNNQDPTQVSRLEDFFRSVDLTVQFTKIPQKLFIWYSLMGTPQTICSMQSKICEALYSRPDSTNILPFLPTHFCSVETCVLGGNNTCSCILMSWVTKLLHTCAAELACLVRCKKLQRVI